MSNSSNTLLAASALILADFDQWPPFALVPKLFLVASAVLQENESTFVILVLNIILYRIWHQLIKQQYQMIAMIDMVIVILLNVLYMILSSGIRPILLSVPYCVWCTFLLVQNLQSTETKPTLPLEQPKLATPPKIRLFPSQPRGGNGFKLAKPI